MFFCIFFVWSREMKRILENLHWSLVCLGQFDFWTKMFIKIKCVADGQRRKDKRVPQNSGAKWLRDCEGVGPLFWRHIANFMQANMQSIRRTTRDRKYETLHEKYNCVVCTEVNPNIIKTSQSFLSANQNISEQNLSVFFKLFLKASQIYSVSSCGLCVYLSVFILG